ncbi:MAG: hypothetical protein AAGB34_01735, partial [Planctomycetota bacterium]
MQLTEEQTRTVLERGRHCLATVSELLKRHAEERAGASKEREDRETRAKKKVERELGELEHWLEQQNELADADLKRRESEIEAELGEQVRKIKRAWDNAKAVEEEAFSVRLAKLNKDHKETVWLAETVGEADEKASQTKYAGVEKVAKKLSDDLESRLKDVQASLTEFKVEVDEGVPSDDSDADDLPTDPKELADRTKTMSEEIGKLADAITMMGTPALVSLAVYIPFSLICGVGAAVGVGLWQGWIPFALILAGALGAGLVGGLRIPLCR